MDGSNPGSGGGGCGCGGECEVNDDCDREVCAMWRAIYSWKHKSDGAKQSLVPASDDSRDSSASDDSRDSLATSGDSVHIVAPPPREVFDLSSSDDDDIVREGTRESCRTQKRVTRSCVKAQKIASTSSPSTKSGYGACKPHDRASVKLGLGSVPVSNNLGGPFQRPYILGQWKTLPLPVERKVKEKVQEIGSELPIFVKLMTKTSVEDFGSTRCKMDFGMEYASAYLPDETRPLLLKMEGKSEVWHATLSVASRGLRQRLVYHGWKEFVGENQLKEGDVCLFQLAGRSTRSLKMTVHLIR